jgi:hypothetical protein
VDEEGGGRYWLTDSGLVPQEQCGGAREGMVLGCSKSRVSHFSLEKGAFFFYSFRVYKSNFHDLLWGQTIFSVHVIWMDIYHYCFPDDALYASESHDQHPGVLKLDAVTQVYTMFSHN